jgi:peptidoglycan/LPS O-acetylase OafA/YrhL
MPSAGSQPGYRPDIDGLRAVAVLLVVGFHVFPEWVPGGFVGVDVFFVISGFLITGILLQEMQAGEFSFARFYARRIRRIFPALIIVLLACFIAGWLILLPDEMRALGKHIAGSAGFVSNFVLLGDSGYFDVAAERKPLLHIWSLGIEEQFYIVWPLILMMVFTLRGRLAWIITSILAASFAFNAYWIGASPMVAFYSPLSRAWELLAGGAFAWLIAHRETEWRFANVRAMTGMGLIVIAVMHLDKSSAFPGWWAVLPVGGAALLISAKSAWLNRNLLCNRIAVFIGLISYPLYLWHWPLLSFHTIVDPEPAALPLRIGLVAVSLMLAWLTYEIVEKPIRYGRFGTALAPRLGFAMLAVAAIGVITIRAGGFDQRLPDPMRHLASTTVDISQWRVHQCLLESNDPTAAFAPDCLEKGSRPLLFLWGDSYAGALYPGLHALRDPLGFRLAQYTTAGCPPILSFVVETRPHCVATNDVVLSTIRSEKPDVVLMHSIWNYPNLAPGTLDRTIAALQDARVGRVVIVGPPPMWNGGLPQAIYEYYKTHGLQGGVPERTRLYLNQGVADLDKILQAKGLALGVNYISLWDMLCNPMGCRTSAGDTLMTMDYGHLSVNGAKYLAGQIAPSLFAKSASAE